MDLGFAVTAFVTLFVVIDPIGLAPIFVALTQGADPAIRRGIALRACLVALVLLAVFGIVGEEILGFIGISMPAFQIAGGLLLFLTALDMLFERRTERREGKAGAPRIPDAPSADAPPGAAPLGIPARPAPAPDALAPDAPPPDAPPPDAPVRSAPGRDATLAGGTAPAATAQGGAARDAVVPRAPAPGDAALARPDPSTGAAGVRDAAIPEPAVAPADRAVQVGGARPATLARSDGAPEARDAGADPSVFPLAMPLIAGPGAMAAMILLGGQAAGDLTRLATVHLVMAAVIGLCLCMFLAAGLIERVLGRIGTLVVTRLLGMLLGALSVQFVLDGLRAAGIVGAAPL